MSNTQENSSTTGAKPEPPKKFRENFDFLKTIGEGSFSTVHLAKDKKSGQLFAIKECYKSQIIREKKVKYVHLEKKILAEYLNDHAFFVKLCFTFQDEGSLYFGLSYCSNSDLLAYIQKLKGFSLAMTEFYAAEIVDALEYMHGKRIVHRDLKPENILLDDKYHIKLTDFGTARILDDETSQETTTAASEDPSTSPKEEKPPARRRNSFVGTAQFVAPECLQGKQPHTGSDLWALGCIVFQMLTQKHLFTGSHEYDIFQKVVKVAYSFPDDFPPTAQDLIRKLVVTEPENRLGAENYSLLKAHEFFASINRSTNLWEQTPPV